MNVYRLCRRGAMIAAVICLCSTGVARALERGTYGQGINIKADTMTHEVNEEIVHASGAVLIEWQGVTLNALEATYNQVTQVLTATGKVVLVKGDDVVRGDRLVMDMVSGKGEFDNASLVMRQGGNFHLTGKRVLRGDDNAMTIEQGSFTTCDGSPPSWRFQADQLKLSPFGYGTGKGVAFYVRDTPVLYMPWLVFPAVRDRQSGFLFPRMGWSNAKGAELDLVYYWAISPSQDLTIHLDSLTKRGVGTGADYRYLRSRGSEGEFNGFLIYDLHKESWRGQTAQTHREIFSPDMNLRVSVNATSDRTFLSDYGDKSGDYNRQANDSTVNFLRTWQNYALTANLRYTENYYTAGNGSTLQTLPEVGLAAVRQQIFTTPLYFDLDSAATNFYREAGPSGQRLTAFPRLTFVTGLPGYVQASFYSGVNFRGYTPGEGSGNGQHDAEGRLLPESGARVSSSVSRVYETGGKVLQKIRHELVPEVSYLYAPNQDTGRLPFYDYTDRPIHANMVQYSVTSLIGARFQGPETTEYRDISRLRLSQAYSIAGTRRDLLTMTDDSRPWSDLILQSDTWLHPQAKLIFDARYNTYDNRIASAAPGFEFDNRLGTTAFFSYHMSRDAVEYLEARVFTKYLKPWNFGYTNRYSFDRSGTLESTYTAEYRHQCWSASLTFRDRPGNPAVLFHFNLEGLTGSTPR